MEHDFIDDPFGKAVGRPPASVRQYPASSMIPLRTRTMGKVNSWICLTGVKDMFMNPEAKFILA